MEKNRLLGSRRVYTSIYRVVKNLWKKYNVVGRDVLEGGDNYAAREICKYWGKLLVITVVRTFIELYLSGRKSRLTRNEHRPNTDI